MLFGLLTLAEQSILIKQSEFPIQGSVSEHRLLATILSRLVLLREGLRVVQDRFRRQILQDVMQRLHRVKVVLGTHLRC